MKKYEKPDYTEIKMNICDVILVSVNEGNALFEETFLDELL